MCVCVCWEGFLLISKGSNTLVGDVTGVESGTDTRQHPALHQASTSQQREAARVVVAAGAAILYCWSTCTQQLCDVRPSTQYIVQHMFDCHAVC